MMRSQKTLSGRAWDAQRMSAQVKSTSHANDGYCSTESVSSVMIIVVFVALIALNFLLTLTLFTNTVKIWPTPVEDSWQFWMLFRFEAGLA
jgi:hypothetical protein